MTETTPSPLGNVITIDDERIKNHLDRVVRGSVEETLNALLDAEADRLCNAQRSERSEARRDSRAGHYERKLQTKAGEVSVQRVEPALGNVCAYQPSGDGVGKAVKRKRANRLIFEQSAQQAVRASRDQHGVGFSY